MSHTSCLGTQACAQWTSRSRSMAPTRPCACCSSRQRRPGACCWSATTPRVRTHFVRFAPVTPLLASMPRVFVRACAWAPCSPPRRRMRDPHALCSAPSFDSSLRSPPSRVVAGRQALADVGQQARGAAATGREAARAAADAARGQAARGCAAVVTTEQGAGFAVRACAAASAAARPGRAAAARRRGREQGRHAQAAPRAGASFGHFDGLRSVA